MEIRDTAKVLAKAAAFDQRTVGEADVMAWHEAIGDLDATDALAAVTRWYRDRADRLMPSHLREAVKLIQAERQRERRLAQAQERAASGPQPAPAVRFADLPAETRAALQPHGRGPLNPILRALMAERFEPNGGRPVNGPNVLDTMYGDPRQDS